MGRSRLRSPVHDRGRPGAGGPGPPGGRPAGRGRRGRSGRPTSGSSHRCAGRGLRPRAVVGGVPRRRFGGRRQRMLERVPDRRRLGSGPGVVAPR
ncbi:MAG: hypothetical protein EKK62_16565, partial [Acidimicrobiia bacterium]